MEELIKEIKSKINIYKKNRENIPLEVLKTKYAKAYNKLREEIKNGVEIIVSSYAHEGIRVHEKDIKTFMPKVDAALEADGLSKRISRLVFRDYNLDAAIEEAKKYRQTVAEELYQEYLRENGYEQT